MDKNTHSSKYLLLCSTRRKKVVSKCGCESVYGAHQKRGRDCEKVGFCLLCGSTEYERNTD